MKIAEFEEYNEFCKKYKIKACRANSLAFYMIYKNKLVIKTIETIN